MLEIPMPSPGKFTVPLDDRWTVQDAADLLGVSRRTVQRMDPEARALLSRRPATLTDLCALEAAELPPLGLTRGVSMPRLEVDGAAIARELHRRRWTWERIADTAQVDLRQVYRWGRQRPRPATASRLLQALAGEAPDLGLRGFVRVRRG